MGTRYFISQLGKKSSVGTDNGFKARKFTYDKFSNSQQVHHSVCQW